MRSIALLLALSAAPAIAASVNKDSPAGRYALDAAACKAKDYFATITESEAVLPTFSCKGVDYDQTENKGGRALYKATAKSCVGEESNEPHKDSFTLIVDSAGLQILWADGTKSAVFTRCAP
ncbi:hypothetical protein [Methylocystis sp. B8]|uniref:hypothetical protein n=1 Tax=Methylocystis sp. B8 TaxID=544938 RepID=UPI0010FE1FBD|nr:hypothetical protein [Methylocystis sp. B8]TLG73984.1 hypothetical protein FEV16_12065 [Methylocystis sp. B8]